MKTPLFASLTAKVAAGVAGVALLTGGAGTVLQLQPASEHKDPTTAADAADETTTTTSTTSTTLAPTTTTTVDDDAETLDAETSDAETKEHPDNFGATVSELAHDGGNGDQDISGMAHDRNDARRAARAAEDDDDTSPAAEHRQNDRPAED